MVLLHMQSAVSCLGVALTDIHVYARHTRRVGWHTVALRSRPCRLHVSQLHSLYGDQYYSSGTIRMPSLDKNLASPCRLRMPTPHSTVSLTSQHNKAPRTECMQICRPILSAGHTLRACQHPRNRCSLNQGAAPFQDKPLSCSCCHADRHVMRAASSSLPTSPCETSAPKKTRVCV